MESRKGLPQFRRMAVVTAMLCAAALTARASNTARASRNSIVMRVEGNGVRLRGEPPRSIDEVNYDRRRLSRGDLVIAHDWAIGVHNEGVGLGLWYYVSVPANGWKGWVSGRYLSGSEEHPTSFGKGREEPAPWTGLVRWVFGYANALDLINNLIALARIICWIVLAWFGWVAARFGYRKVRSNAEAPPVGQNAAAAPATEPPTFGSSSNLAWCFPEARRRPMGR